jgi:hypothetical protein
MKKVLKLSFKKGTSEYDKIFLITKRSDHLKLEKAKLIKDKVRLSSLDNINAEIEALEKQRLSCLEKIRIATELNLF